MGAGFLNCQPLRALGENAALLNRALQPGDIVTLPDLDPGNNTGATDQRHVFVRQNAPPVSIRFVHGSPNLPYLQDIESTLLHISNHQTTRGGNEDQATLPAGFGFNTLGHDDPDTFKVEIVDPQAASPINVRLESLRRVALPAGGFGHGLFPAAERARRSLDPLECRIVSSGVAFRSRYMRLVTDDTDKAALPDQTLLVTDMTDEGDSTVEILEQAVRATYVLQNCPAAACSVSRTIPVGETAGPRKPRHAIRMAIHIMTTAPGNAGVVTIAQADRRIHRWVRRTYAQAGLAPRLVTATRIVDPQDNLVAIGDPGGLTASGGGQMGFRITSTGGPTQVIGPVATVAGMTPGATAAILAGLVTAPYTATVSLNPPGFTDLVANQSADILITLAGDLVTIDQEVSTDARQPLTVGRPDPAALVGWGNNWLVGSIEQRTLLKNYETGDDRVDVIVVDTIASGDRGQAMMHGVNIDAQRAASAEIRFSAFVNAVSMNSSDDDFVNLAHEMGHVLMDLIHATGTRSGQQLMMGQGTTFLVAEDASKRIKERPQRFDSPAGNHRQIDSIHTRAAGVLAAF